MQPVLKLSLTLNQQYIKIDWKNLQETNWDEVTEEWMLDVYKFRIDVKKDDVSQWRGVLPVLLFNVDTCEEGQSIKKNIEKMFVWHYINAP